MFVCVYRHIWGCVWVYISSLIHWKQKRFENLRVYSSLSYKFVYCISSVSGQVFSSLYSLLHHCILPSLHHHTTSCYGHHTTPLFPPTTTLNHTTVHHTSPPPISLSLSPSLQQQSRPIDSFPKLIKHPEGTLPTPTGGSLHLAEMIRWGGNPPTPGNLNLGKEPFLKPRPTHRTLHEASRPMDHSMSQKLQQVRQDFGWHYIPKFNDFHLSIRSEATGFIKVINSLMFPFVAGMRWMDGSLWWEAADWM